MVSGSVSNIFSTLSKALVRRYPGSQGFGSRVLEVEGFRGLGFRVQGLGFGFRGGA